MGLLETQQEMFCCFLGKMLKENKWLFLQSLSSQSGKDAPQPWVNIPLKCFLPGTKGSFQRMEVTVTQRLDWDHHLDFHLPDSHPIGVEDLVLVLKNVKTLTHTHNIKHRVQNLTKRSNNQTGNHNQCSVPPKSLPYQLLVLD